MNPLKYVHGLQVELELLNNKADAALIYNSKSPVMQISGVCINSDVLMLDSQLDNELTSHVLPTR